jgi:AcrR family transcriptional regulator
LARKVGITRSDVITAAEAIADRDGLDHLTLAGVADALGVRSPSLYAHVEGLPGLRRALQIHAAQVLTSTFREATDRHSGDQALGIVAHAYRRFAHEHPGLLDALLPAPRPGEDDEVYEALADTALVVAGAVTSMGVPEENAVDAVRSLRSAVHGFVVLEKDGGFGMPEDIDDSFEAMVQVIVSGLHNT